MFPPAVLCGLYSLVIVFGIIHSHWLVVSIAFFIWLLRYTVQAIVINKTATDQEENRHYYFSLLLFDLLQPLQTLQLAFTAYIAVKETS